MCSRVPITDQWKGYLWKPQLQMRICNIFLLTPFHSYSRNSDHKTAALNGVRGTCFSFGIAVSVPANKKKLGNRHFCEILYTNVLQGLQ